VSVFLAIAAVLSSGPAPVLFHSASMEKIQSRPEPSKPARQSVEQIVSAFYEHLYAGKFDQALSAANRIDPASDNPNGRAIVAAMRASALLGLKRDEEAKRLISEANTLAPDESTVGSTLFLGALVVDRIDIAADAFDRLIARTPDAVNDLDKELVWHFLRNEPKGEEKRNDDRRVALARLGYAGDSTSGDYFTKRAVDILVKRGDIAAARELLPRIDEPQIVENLLVQKRYSALWPDLEARVGPHLEKVRGSSVVSAERAYAEDRNNHENLQLLVDALRHAGRHAEAIALKDKLPLTREAMASADQDQGWVLNNIALSLHEVGRADEADQLFALLNEAPMDEGRWRVSMIINRAELLVADGKFEKALPLLRLTEASAEKDGNPYAQQLVRRLKYCTLSGLGRKAEAAKFRPQLLEHAKDAPGPTIDGLVCGGDLDEAEKLALAWLKDEDKDFGEDFVRGLQARPLTSDDPSVWSKGWRELRNRPAVSAEFQRLGRDMPEQFLPPPIN
jgi:tetratricopeptide (TPR) repeat protein